MAARIAWTRSGLLTCLRGTVRLGAAILAEDVLDIGARDDGSVLIVTATEAAQLAPSGAEIERHAMGYFNPATMVALATESLHVAVRGGHGADPHVHLHAFGGEHVCTIERDRFEIPYHAFVSVGISPSGRLVALGYDTAGGAGWVVVDRVAMKLVDRGFVPTTPKGSKRPTMQFAFDRSERRCVHAMPESKATIGPIRLGRSDRHQLSHPGDARAVALSRRGVIAAYAYRTTPPGAHGRLRVDYLAHLARGPAMIEIQATHWIEPGVGEIAALAFDDSEHAIACLGETGVTEIVPVP